MFAVLLNLIFLCLLQVIVLVTAFPNRDESFKPSSGISKSRADVVSTYLDFGSKKKHCWKNWESFKEHEKYRFHHIEYQCHDGIMYPEGCFFGNKALAPGAIYIDDNNNSYHECFRNGTIVGYREVICDNTECKKDMFEAEDLLNLFRVKEEEESTVKVAQSHVFKTIFDFGGPNCTKDGKTFKEREEYKVEHLRYQCKDGFMHPIGCKVGDKDLNPGDVLNDKENSSYHECFQIGTRIGYREVFCGSENPCPRFKEIQITRS
uniref:Abnormal cell migration protein 18-like fibronectin type I domain-containing protein n=1 Tax=Acrobeloides nanus TaxID=290746 RepID=A0A914E960_9BILA